MPGAHGKGDFTKVSGHLGEAARFYEDCDVMTFIRSILTEADMSEALAARRQDLGLLQEEVEHRVGLTQGHVGKVEAGDKSWGKRPFRIENPVRMSATLMWLLEAYGLKLLLVDEDTARQLMPADVKATIREHRNKETQEIHPTAGQLVTVMRRRPDAQSGNTCGAFLPESINPELPSDS